MQANDSRIERYYSMNGYMRVSMDFKHGYVLVGDGNGAMYIMTLADLKNGSYNIKYAFSIFNYGYEASQTYQSQTLDFPYVYWDSGDVDLHDNRMLYGVNVVHGGQEFALNLMLDMDFKTADDVMEPETVKAIYDSTGNSTLLLTFNCWVNGSPIERAYSIPVKTRQAAGTLSTSTTSDSSTD